jgi:hypothetical protein
MYYIVASFFVDKSSSTGRYIRDNIIGSTESDQHKVVENDADITDYLVHCVVYNSIKDYIKLEDEGSLFTSLKL